MTFLPLRAVNPNTHTSIPLDIVAAAANPFLSRAASIRNEEYLPWDVDDVVGVCINLIDQVPPSTSTSDVVQGYIKGHIQMGHPARLLTLAKNESYGFTRVCDVINSKVTGMQMYIR